MITVEFKNSAMETATECTNRHCHLANLNLTKANFTSGVSSEQPTARVPYVCLHYYIIRLAGTSEELWENFTSLQLHFKLYFGKTTSEKLLRKTTSGNFGKLRKTTSGNFGKLAFEWCPFCRNLFNDKSFVSIAKKDLYGIFQAWM